MENFSCGLRRSHSVENIDEETPHPRETSTPVDQENTSQRLNATYGQRLKASRELAQEMFNYPNWQDQKDLVKRDIEDMESTLKRMSSIRKDIRGCNRLGKKNASLEHYGQIFEETERRVARRHSLYQHRRWQADQEKARQRVIKREEMIQREREIEAKRDREEMMQREREIEANREREVLIKREREIEANRESEEMERKKEGESETEDELEREARYERYNQIKRQMRIESMDPREREKEREKEREGHFAFDRLMQSISVREKKRELQNVGIYRKRSVNGVPVRRRVVRSRTFHEGIQLGAKLLSNDRELKSTFMDDNIINSLLKVVKVTAELIDDKECCICYNLGDHPPLAVDEDAAQCPRCTQCFHWDCANKWLLEYNHCPRCRLELITDDSVVL